MKRRSTIEVSLPSCMLMRHLLSMEMGNCPVAFKASRAFLYSLAISMRSLGRSSCEAPPSMLEYVAPLAFRPIVTLFLPRSSCCSSVAILSVTEPLTDRLPPTVMCCACYSLLVVFCTSILPGTFVLELTPKSDIMRLSSRSAISLSICMLRFSINMLFTMATASKFTANSSSLIPCALMSSTYFFRAMS